MRLCPQRSNATAWWRFCGGVDAAVVVVVVVSARHTFSWCVLPVAALALLQPFGFGSGQQHTLKSLLRMDKIWRKRVFGQGADKKLPPPNEIERKYWEIVEGEDHFNTFYGSDIDTTVHGRLARPCLCVYLSVPRVSVCLTCRPLRR